MFQQQSLTHEHTNFYCNQNFSSFSLFYVWAKIKFSIETWERKFNWFPFLCFFCSHFFKIRFCCLRFFIYFESRHMKRENYIFQKWAIEGKILHVKQILILKRERGSEWENLIHLSLFSPLFILFISMLFSLSLQMNYLRQATSWEISFFVSLSLIHYFTLFVVCSLLLLLKRLRNISY